MESHFRFPAENFFCFRCITKQQVDFGWALVARIVLYKLLPIQIRVPKRRLDEFAHGMRFAGSQHEVVPFAELHKSPHAFDVLRRVSPIAFRIQITEEQLLLHALLDGSDGTRNFATDKSFTASRAFMIEHDAVASA